MRLGPSTSSLSQQRRPSCRRPRSEWTGGGGRKWRRRATWQARWPTFGVPAGRTPLIKGPPRSSNAGSAKAAAGEVGGTAKRRPPKGTRGPACQGPLQGGWAASIARQRGCCCAEAQRRCRMIGKQFPFGPPKNSHSLAIPEIHGTGFVQIPEYHVVLIQCVLATRCERKAGRSRRNVKWRWEEGPEFAQSSSAVPKGRAR